MKIKFLDYFKFPEGCRIPYVSGLFYRIISKIERKQIQRLKIDKFCLNDKKGRNEKIIVSLTSFPARINCVHLAIRSLMAQTCKPDKIILWLAKEQFTDKILPKLLTDLCEYGLEIRYCDDLRSHKKYYYALKEQQENELVITYDDDLIYPEDSIERLYKKHKQYPNCIVCNRAQESKIEDGKLCKYSTWKVLSNEGVKKPSTKLFPSTGGGTLYPFNAVSDEVFNKEVILNSAFSADDIWMRFMSAKAKTKIIKTRKHHKTFTTILGSQVESLQVENCLEGGNDKVIENLSTLYPEAVEFIDSKG